MRSLFKLALIGAAFLGALATSADAAKAQEVTLKLHHFLPPVAHAHKNMLAPWAKKVEEASGGRLKIEIYPAMQLGGKPPQLADQARDGVVDIVWTLPGYTPGRFHSLKPIRTVADISGLKIRTPTRTGGWLIEAMGATPVGAPVPKIPEMLSKGVVDAVLIPWEVTLPLKVDELVDYHTLLDDPKTTRINTSTFMIAMNKDSYNNLPSDLQKVIDDNSGMNIARWLGEIWDKAEEPGMKKAAASGEIIKMAPAEVAKLRAMVEQPVIDRWVADVNGKGIDGKALVEEARQLISKYSQ
jgi:TRAP-type C4-dicarboxylate transport system substrate-binding protein